MTCFLAQDPDELLYTILYLHEGKLCYNRRRGERWSYDLMKVFTTVSTNPDPVPTSMKVNILYEFTTDSIPTINTHPELFI